MTQQEHGSVAMGDTEQMIEAARQELLYWDFIVPKDIISCALNAALSSRPAQEPVGTQHRLRIRGLKKDPCGEWSEWRDNPANLSDRFSDYLEVETRNIYAAPQPAHGTSATERVVDVGVERLRDELHSAACLLETMAEALPEDDVKAVMMSVMAQRNRAVLDGEAAPAPAPAPNAVMGGQGVEVKPLEWDGHNSLSLGLEYHVWWYEMGKCWLAASRTRGIGDGFASSDAAKAAAQADYERRILSALSIPTPKEESK